jgi:hypothetical protein
MEALMLSPQKMTLLEIIRGLGFDFAGRYPRTPSKCVKPAARKAVSKRLSGISKKISKLVLTIPIDRQYLSTKDFLEFVWDKLTRDLDKSEVFIENREALTEAMPLLIALTLIMQHQESEAYPVIMAVRTKINSYKDAVQAAAEGQNGVKKHDDPEYVVPQLVKILDSSEIKLLRPAHLNALTTMARKLAAGGDMDAMKLLAEIEVPDYSRVLLSENFPNDDQKFIEDNDDDDMKLPEPMAIPAPSNEAVENNQALAIR